MMRNKTKFAAIGGSITFIFLYIKRRIMKMSIKYDSIKNGFEEGQESSKICVSDNRIHVDVKKPNISETVNEVFEKIKTKHNEEMVSKKLMMTPMEREELTRRVKAMTLEELGVVVDNLPIELCLGRIAKEIDRAKALENRIKSVTETL